MLLVNTAEGLCHHWISPLERVSNHWIVQGTYRSLVTSAEQFWWNAGRESQVGQGSGGNDEVSIIVS